jgi:hypothetical protein
MFLIMAIYIHQDNMYLTPHTAGVIEAPVWCRYSTSPDVAGGFP